MITEEMKEDVFRVYHNKWARTHAIDAIEVYLFEEKYNMTPEFFETLDMDNDIKTKAKTIERELHKLYYSIR